MTTMEKGPEAKLREERTAAALRENLHRRKQQQQARAAQTDVPAATAKKD